MAKARNHRKLTRRRSLIEQMESRLPLAGDVGHNFLLPGDVNDDRAVSAGDALAIINMLAEQKHEARMAPEGEAVDASFASMFYDVNDDGQASASDALRVINELARESESSESDDAVQWLQSDTGVRAKIELHVAGTDRAEFEVRLSGAPANESLDVVVDGQVLGQIQTNESGRGALELEYGGEHPPMPDVLATANSETPVSIGDIVSGTLGSLGELQVSDGGIDDGSEADDDDGGDAATDATSDADSDSSTSADTDASTDISPDSSSIRVAGSGASAAADDSDSSPTSDGGIDQVSDGGTDGGSDSTPVSNSNGGTDGGVDGSSDESPDEDSDQSLDGESDASIDASSDGGSDGGGT